MQSYGTPSMHIRARKVASPIRVAWVCAENWEAAQSRIRVLKVSEKLRKLGYQSTVIQNYSDVLKFNFHTVIIGKSFSENDYKQVEMLKLSGKRIIMDLCEDLIGWAWVNELIGLCDKVICCSHELEKKVRTIHNNTAVIEDAYEC